MGGTAVETQIKVLTVSPNHLGVDDALLFTAVKTQNKILAVSSPTWAS
jgi:hypothetical protein